MGKGRIEAFSDGVIAILITIMVLDLKLPADATLDALVRVLPTLGAYLLSFVLVGIYWNNHHHMFQATDRVNGAILWANLHLLFWLSLIPFGTRWISETHGAALPMAMYGVDLICCGAAYTILQTLIIRVTGPDSTLARAVRRDIKGKLSLVIYAAGIGLAFVNPVLPAICYGGVALLWLVPDPRIEKMVSSPGSPGQ
jgi:uncharacterized membrane protein